MPSNNGNTILLVHPPSLNPSTFLNRLTGSEIAQDGEAVHWKIDNKYYTAEVDIQTLSLGQISDGTAVAQWKEVDVVLYIFEKIPISLPTTLVKLLSTPRDIALAVRTIPVSTNEEANADEDEVVSVEQNGNIPELEEMFNETGMEFIDEVNPLTEEDDERPMEPLEIIRQTLMTHIWPSMIRKPLNMANSSEIPSEISPSSSVSSSPKPFTFPETFQSSSSLSTSIALSTTVLPESSFPNLEELRAEIIKANFSEIDKLDNKLGNGFGFELDQNEFDKLEDWLDSDEDDDINDDNEGYQMMQDDEDDFNQNGNEEGEDWLDKDDEKFEPTPPGNYTSAFPSGSASGSGPHQPTPPIPSTSKVKDEGDWLDFDDKKFDPILSDLPTRSTSAIQPFQQEEGFEDDFVFTEFQSAPAPAAHQTLERIDPTLALDPTPLLLHLQSVRAELAGVPDENERRERAGREVQQILASLGMGDLAEDDLGFDDI